MSERRETDAEHEKNEPNDMFCSTVARAVSDVVRYSLNESFRQHCFQTLHVDNTKDAESQIHVELRRMIRKRPKKRRRGKISEEIGEPETSLSNSATSSEKAGDNPSSQCQIHAGSRNNLFHNKNWLQLLLERKQQRVGNSTRNHMSQIPKEGTKRRDLFPNLTQ